MIHVKLTLSDRGLGFASGVGRRDVEAFRGNASANLAWYRCRGNRAWRDASGHLGLEDFCQQSTCNFTEQHYTNAQLLIAVSVLSAL